VCKCCDLGVREDELHFMACSAFNDIRLEYMNTLRLDQQGLVADMDAFMKSCMTPYSGCHDIKYFWRQFAHYLSKCRDKRESLITQQAG